MKETLKKLVELQGIDSEKLDLKYKRQEVLNSLVADKKDYESLERRVADEKQRQQSIREEGQRLTREQAQLEARTANLEKGSILLGTPQRARLSAARSLLTRISFRSISRRSIVRIPTWKKAFRNLPACSPSSLPRGLNWPKRCRA
ncbi:hypothetical protein IKS38_00910 [bacterium]|nr:hypothetical protein [bacterium]